MTAHSQRAELAVQDHVAEVLVQTGCCKSDVQTPCAVQQSAGAEMQKWMCRVDVQNASAEMLVHNDGAELPCRIHVQCSIAYTSDHAGVELQK